MKSIWKQASLVAVAISSLAVFVTAQEGPAFCHRGEKGMNCPKEHMDDNGSGKGMHKGPGMGHPGFLNPKMMLEIGLSMDQQAKLKAFHEQNGPTMESLMQDRQKLDKELFDALSQTPVAKDRLEKAKLALLAISAKEIDHRIQASTLFLSLLTAEQKKKFMEIQAAQEKDPSPPKR